MKFETSYINKSFKDHMLATWVIMALGLFFFSFAWIAFMTSYFHSEEIVGKHSFIKGLSIGIKHYAMIHVWISIVLFEVLFLLGYLLIKNHVNNRKIIVAIEFDESEHKISLFRKRLHNKVVQETYPQEKLFYKRIEKENDGISMDGYECINILHKSNIIGRIFVNHFTWPNNAGTKQMTETLFQWIKPVKNHLNDH